MSFRISSEAKSLLIRAAVLQHTNVTDFCGDDTLNQFLHCYARQGHEKGAANHAALAAAKKL